MQRGLGVLDLAQKTIDGSLAPSAPRTVKGGRLPGKERSGFVRIIPLAFFPRIVSWTFERGRGTLRILDQRTPSLCNRENAVY